MKPFDWGLPTLVVLLFGQAPQRFLISSEIKCAHFHGTEVAKPIPSYQVYKGTVFGLVDQAVDFVLSKITLSVGTRSESVQAPVKYEIPKEVVTEAIVNAAAHRDYTDRGPSRRKRDPARNQPGNRQKTTRKPPENHQKRRPITRTPVPL